MTTDTHVSFTNKERLVLSCLFDGNYWSPEELLQMCGGNLAGISAFLLRLLNDGWVERLDLEKPLQFRRTRDWPDELDGAYVESPKDVFTIDDDTNDRTWAVLLQFDNPQTRDAFVAALASEKEEGNPS